MSTYDLFVATWWNVSFDTCLFDCLVCKVLLELDPTAVFLLQVLVDIMMTWHFLTRGDKLIIARACASLVRP